MYHDEAFEFFMEVKNKEIQELKDKLERTKAAGDAMINAGIRNTKLLLKRGNEMYQYLSELYDTSEGEHELRNQIADFLHNWEEAREGRKGNDA